MKNILFPVLFLVSLGLLFVRSINANPDTLQKEHGQLVSKVNNFFSSNKSAIESRIQKTERFASTCSKDTIGVKSLINLYKSDSAFYQTVIQQGDSLFQNLMAHDKLVRETMQKGKMYDKFLEENKASIDKIKWIINYAKDVSKQVENRLKSATKELQEMRYYYLKQMKREQKK